MAKKHNKKPQDLDLSSFAFASKCAGCHPGGGPVEYDRDGKRYDIFAMDPVNKIVPGGENNLDGDYYRSMWAQTGVIEADCLLCHLPEYHYEVRKQQITTAMNFRWAATAGAGFGIVKGAITRDEKPVVIYDKALFRPDGRVALHMVKEVPSENCLFCHREPDWKKKGASYSGRTDVHIRAGLKCVDCHVTGMHATDKRIYGREMHEIGKGDDPTGLVRNDLDNTMRTCEDCHLKGSFKAPVPRHYGLPPVHLEKIACQTCHSPQIQVKAALLQDSSIFNTSPRIPLPGKRIWTFYGPDMKPWNLYGEANTFTAERQPLFVYEPVRGWYKGKIYPLNRVDSIWIGIVSADGKILDQAYMSELYKMWASHLKDPEHNFPELSVIRDDNGDGALEANRPVEIKGLLHSMTKFLLQRGRLSQGSQPVLVSGKRYTADGQQWKSLPYSPKPWEYTPYGSVFKLNHAIAPADEALGAGGCSDCHSSDSSFWNRKVMTEPFSGNREANPSYISNAMLLGLSPFGVKMGALRHETLEPLLFYGMLIALACFVLVTLTNGLLLRPGSGLGLFTEPEMRLMLAILGVAFLGPGVILIGGKLLSARAIGNLENFHKMAAMAFVLALLWVTLKSDAKKSGLFWTGFLGVFYMAITGAILLFNHAMDIRQVVFTLHDMGAVVLCILAVMALFIRMFRFYRKNEVEDSEL